MRNTVDYDEMFGTSCRQQSLSPEAEKKRQYEERARKDAAERQGMTETVEQFRSRPKNSEGFLARSDTFTDLQKKRNPYAFRRGEISFLDVLVDYVDGFAVGTLLAVITWLICHSFIPVVIAGLIGFIGGLLLQFCVHDGLSVKEALRKGLPAFIVAAIVVISAIIRD